MRDGTYFLCPAKKVSKESGLTTPILVFTHGLSTSPCFAWRRAGLGSLQASWRMPHPLRTPAQGLTTSNVLGRFAANSVQVVGPHRHRAAPAPVGASRREGSCAVRTPTQSLPHRELEYSTSRAATRVHESGGALNQCAGNERGQDRCIKKYGDVESPWVTVKDWRCEPAFFAYFLCAGAPKEVPLGDKESRCRPRTGSTPAPRRRIADVSKKLKKHQCRRQKTTSDKVHPSLHRPDRTRQIVPAAAAHRRHQPLPSAQR